MKPRARAFAATTIEAFARLFSLAQARAETAAALVEGDDPAAAAGELQEAADAARVAADGARRLADSLASETPEVRP